MSDPSAGSGQVDALTAALRAAPELRQSPATAVSLIGASQTPAADAQAAGMALQTQAATAAAQDVSTLAGPNVGQDLQHHKKGGIGGFLGGLAHDVANDVIAPVQRDVMKPVSNITVIPETDLPVIGHVKRQTLGGPVGQVITAGIAGGAFSQALSIANTPLQQVQHEYRYIHDVWTRHGVVPAIAEMAAMGLTGAVAYRATGSSNAAILAAEGVGGIEGQIFYHDSWDRTANGNAYRSSGQNVSPGRDVANLLGVPTSGAQHGMVSGVVDGLFDLMMDPLAKSGGLYGEAKSPAGLGGSAGKLFGGTGATQAGDAERAYSQYPSVRRAAQEIADTGNAAKLADRFPVLTQDPGLAARLADTDTAHGVIGVLEDRVAAEQAVAGQYTEWRQAPFGRDEYGRALTEGDLQPEPAKPNVLFAQGLPRTTRLGQATSRAMETVENVSSKARSLEKVPIGGTWSAVGDQGVEQIRQQLLQGMSPRAVNDVLDEYLRTTDVNVRQDIVKSATQAMIFNRAGVDPAELDAGLRDKVIAKLDTLMGGETPNKLGAYGGDASGNDLSTIPTADGAGSQGAAIWDYQQADRHLLSYNDVKDLSQQVRGYRGWFGLPGQVDQFAWDKFTSPWRKLALLTGSFAAHITIAEDMMNAVRVGFGDWVDSAVKQTVSKLGYEVSSDEAGPIRAFVYRMLGSPHAEVLQAAANDPAKFAELQKDIDLYTHLAVATDGHMISPEVSAGYVLPSSAQAPVETMRQGMRSGVMTIPRGMKVSDNFAMVGDADPNFDVWWGQHLNGIARDQTGRVAAQVYGAGLTHGLTEEEASTRAMQAVEQTIHGWSPAKQQQFARMLRSPAGMEDVDPVTAFAKTKVESLKGAVYGADGTLHTDLLGKVANGDTISYTDVKGVNPGQVPAAIPGREMMPNADSKIDRLAELGHSKVLSPIINTFSRMPTFGAEVKDAYAVYEPMVDAGVLDRGVAMDMAMRDAGEKMIKYVHNPQERLQLTETMRNVAPFGFAQVQAYKRYGRLLKSDPGAFRQLQMMLTGMTQLSNRAKDPGGVQQVVYPGSGWVTHGMLAAAATLGMPVTSAVPVSFAGSTSSMQAVDPFMQGVSGIRPSVGPLVSVAAHLVDQFDPHAQQVVASALGSTIANESILNVIPNTPVRDLIKAGMPSAPGVLRSNDSIWLQTLANLDYQQNVAVGKWQQTQAYKDFVGNGGDENSVEALAAGRPDIVPPPEAPASTRQKFVDSVRNQARFVGIVQAVMAEVSPASPLALVGNKRIPAEFQKLVAKEGINQAYIDFANKYPDAGPLIQSMSKTTDGGVLSASAKTQKWIDGNLGWVDAHPNIASLFVPQAKSDSYSPSAYNEQIGMGLRHRTSPQEFQDAFYVNSGWSQYDENAQVHHDEIARLKAAGADTTSETSNWDQWLQGFQLQNPVWAAAFNDPNNKIRAQQALRDLRTVIGSKDVPATPQTAALTGLLEDYDSHVNALQPSASGQISYSSNVNAAEMASWRQYVKDKAKSDPQLAPAINLIFRWVN